MSGLTAIRDYTGSTFNVKRDPYADARGLEKIGAFIQNSGLFAWTERLIEAFHDVWLWVVSLFTSPAQEIEAAGQVIEGVKHFDSEYCKYVDHLKRLVDINGIKSTLEMIEDEELRDHVSTCWADPFLSLQDHGPDGIEWLDIYADAENRKSYLVFENKDDTYTVKGIATHADHIVGVSTTISRNEKGEVTTKEEVTYKTREEFMQPKKVACRLRETYTLCEGESLLEDFRRMFFDRVEELPFGPMTIGGATVEKKDTLVSEMKQLGDFSTPSMKVVQHYLVNPFVSIATDFKEELELIGIEGELAYIYGEEKKVSLTFKDGVYRIEAELSYDRKKITIFTDIGQDAPSMTATVSFQVEDLTEKGA